MSDVSYEKMVRGVGRAKETYESAEVHPIVKTMYEGLVATPTAAFLVTHQGVADAETQVGAANTAAAPVLAELTILYGIVRAMLAGRFPDQVLPRSFKEQPTDTDRKHAAETLRSLVARHAGEPWADELLTGPFGTTTADAIAKIDATIAAKSNLAAKQAARSAAFGAVYPMYLAFKDAVLHAHGSTSPLYRRLRLRNRNAAAPVPTPEPPVVTQGPVVAAGLTPTNGAGAAH